MVCQGERKGARSVRLGGRVWRQCSQRWECCSNQHSEGSGVITIAQLSRRCRLYSKNNSFILFQISNLSLVIDFFLSTNNFRVADWLPQAT